ncbi:uncharacterized protein Z520_07574 [Fonsecaea multimorphosa CBS 102226]|uniref:AB hydrolase-1 domain-containing protein n=1 Tax=Fonsecaea multimorphosa CBS 102226 TaxID=1442371 RepID=A0A0D2K1G2_9EURO|nr:uncharacterized protein Z520_07574 [Fonsecaea multimorphosa CBS 102226]KIX96854.1 hypothetical protein Z520_07574 [Fonsecaea multimorphosa CBS 102226]OAL22533.1 hypothetical protein AYO22_07091 [Fonsecaea multimorphosa]
MASTFLGRLIRQVSFYSFGFFNWCLFLGLFVKNGTFFRKDTEQDKLQFAIERDRFWNLTKSPLPGFKHFFYTLRNGLRLHYISNRDGTSQGNLVIFFHGFPDSSMMWRHLMQEPAMPIRDATLVCVDLPGYGGSDSFKKYDTEVLEALTEFVVAMRDKYIPAEDSDETSTFIVGHDWGCVLGFRLAAEAACLADRFILTNAPHVELAFANRDRILNSASKIFKQFKQSPKQNFGCLSKALNTLKPLMVQTLLMGYIFAFHLPSIFVRYLGVAGNYSFVRGANWSSYTKGSKEYRAQECMASSFGPGPEECKTSIPTVNGVADTTNGETQANCYGPSVLQRARSPQEAFWNMTGYYRDGVGWRPWTKSLETITDLYALETSASESSSPGRRRSSISQSLFVDQYKGSLKAPTYVLWGEKDQACSKRICLDGIGDYLGRDSEVTILPRSGHWTPVQKEARPALATAIGLFAGGGARPVAKMTTEVEKVYQGAVLMVKK